MRLNNKRRYRMAVESLEEKRLLAGDVTAQVVNGNLLVWGDESSNGVAITSGEAPGHYVVGGLLAGDAPTTVNGRPHRAMFDGVRGDILVRMGDGDDTANLFDLRSGGNVSVGTGAGNDHVNFGGPRNDAGGPNSAIRGSLRVDTGEGNDSLRVGSSTLGSGLQANTGGGNDYVAVVDSHLEGFTSIATDGGNDQVVFEGSRTNFARIGTGSGSDRVALIDSAFSGVYVVAGGDDDAVTLHGLTARVGWFQGGRGNDTLHLVGENHVNHLRIGGFETIQGQVGDGATLDGIHRDAFASAKLSDALQRGSA